MTRSQPPLAVTPCTVVRGDDIIDGRPATGSTYLVGGSSDPYSSGGSDTIYGGSGHNIIFSGPGSSASGLSFAGEFAGHSLDFGGAMADEIHASGYDTVLAGGG